MWEFETLTAYFSFYCKIFVYVIYLVFNYIYTRNGFHANNNAHYNNKCEVWVVETWAKMRMKKGRKWFGENRNLNIVESFKLHL